ncbi:hypothetical protein [uncultured Microbacterium sp.]|uniref:hypothetical protein n=1 Tax=uncultured Microbacterium sp. TaxID=191216 RepID=UPI0026270132|nr:hypothetical protein [uncultured Microbacterium sp.]
MKAQRSALIAALLLSVTGIAGCSAPADPASEASSPPSSSPSASAPSTAPPSPTPTPTPTEEPVVIPNDCRAILSADVLAQLDGIPLNDPAIGENGGRQADGSLLCMWADPRADTTGLATYISYERRGPALEMLNDLVTEEDFTCYESQGGTRCEKTWENELYPVADGRTLFWRGGILIDTQYSNLSPTGYTASIVDNLFG